MYYFYFDKLLLPVAPPSLDIKINNQNKTVNLINESEINILKNPGLTDIDFEFMLPQVKYPFAVYKDGFQKAKYYLDAIEKLKVNKTPFQFIVTRSLPNGGLLFDTNIKVSIEDYSINEDSENGFDVFVPISLKQYRPYGTKLYVIKKASKSTVKKASRNTKTFTPTTHKIKKGDTLVIIAKKYYGDSSTSKRNKIFNANKKKIKNKNKLVVGTVLTIPK